MFNFNARGGHDKIIFPSLQDGRLREFSIQIVFAKGHAQA